MAAAQYLPQSLRMCANLDQKSSMQFNNLFFALRMAKLVLALNALGAFFFDFVHIGLKNHGVTLLGLDLIFGPVLSSKQVSGIPNVWAVLLLLVCVLQFLAMAFWRNRTALWCLTAIGVFILVLLQLDFLTKWQSSGVSVCFGYWLLLGIFFGIAVCHVADGGQSVKKQHLHINIFTQRKE